MYTTLRLISFLVYLTLQLEAPFAYAGGESHGTDDCEDLDTLKEVNPALWEFCVEFVVDEPLDKIISE